MIHSEGSHRQNNSQSSAMDVTIVFQEIAEDVILIIYPVEKAASSTIT